MKLLFQRLSSVMHNYTLLTILSLVIAWQLLISIFHPPVYIIPSPVSVFVKLTGEIPALLRNGLATGQAIIIGFVIAVIFGIPTALIIAFSKFFERTLYPLLVFSQLVPKIALAPVFIIWFGFGITSKVLITALLCYFPLVVDSLAGFRALEPDIEQLARSMKASRWDFFIKVRLPAALPHIFSGLKVSITMATVGAVIGEFVGSDIGLGHLLLQANGDLDTPLLFSTLIVLTAIGLIYYYIVEFLEKIAIPWHVSMRKKGISNVEGEE
jgi:NitT/TauT family transport system permease protein